MLWKRIQGVINSASGVRKRSRRKRKNMVTLEQDLEIGIWSLKEAFPSLTDGPSSRFFLRKKKKKNLAIIILSFSPMTLPWGTGIHHFQLCVVFTFLGICGLFPSSSSTCLMGRRAFPLPPASAPLLEDCHGCSRSLPGFPAQTTLLCILKNRCSEASLF